jgi:hypothetical protein
MFIQPKIKILGRGKLSRINEINLLKIKTGAKRGQNSFALDTRELLSRKSPVFLVCCGWSDETRTRDLRRDRPFCALINSICYEEADVISRHMTAY